MTLFAWHAASQQLVCFVQHGPDGSPIRAIGVGIDAVQAFDGQATSHNLERALPEFLAPGEQLRSIVTGSVADISAARALEQTRRKMNGQLRGPRAR